MSLEYTLRGPTTVQLSGPVLTPSGPFILDATPLTVSDAPVVGETVTIHYATRNLTISDAVTVREAASKDVTPINLSDTLSATDKVALVLEDDVVVNEGLDLSPAMVGSQVRVNPFFPGTGSVGSPIKAGISYTPIDVIGSAVQTSPFFTPTDMTGSSLRFKANLPTAAASDALTVVERLDVIQHPKDALTAHEALGREWDLSVTDHVSILVDNVSSGPLVLDHLFPTEAIGRIFSLSVTDSMSATDGVALGFSDHLTVTEREGYERDVTDSITVSETISVTSSLNDHLVFVESIVPETFMPVEDDLLVADAVHRVFPFSLSDHLVVADGLTGQGVLKAPTDVLAVVETLTPSNIYNRAITDVLSVADGVIRIGSIVIGITGVCEEGYSPIVPLGKRNNVVLTWPYAAPSLTIILRNPKFGNVDTVNTNTNFERTRSGQLSVVRDPTWPLIEVLRVAFDAIDETTKLNFENFIEQSAAFEIGYLDQENRQWRGFMTNPFFDTTQVGIGCQFTFSFEFRGRLA